MRLSIHGLLFAACLASSPCGSAKADDHFARDPQQPVDQAYTAKIAKYTTQADFNSPLTDYLPASNTVPTPENVLGDVAGAPNMLPYAEDVYRYFRLLEKSTPRVKVFTIGHTEEGRGHRQADDADLLHHRDHPFHRDRFTDFGDGARLSPRRRRRALHPVHP
jgi:hypothetical protein